MGVLATGGMSILPCRFHGPTKRLQRTRGRPSASARKFDGGHPPQMTPHGRFGPRKASPGSRDVASSLQSLSRNSSGRPSCAAGRGGEVTKSGKFTFRLLSVSRCVFALFSALCDLSANLSNLIQSTDLEWIKLEAEEGIEPSNDGFANHCLTTWLLRPIRSGPFG